MSTSIALQPLNTCGSSNLRNRAPLQHATATPPSTSSHEPNPNPLHDTPPSPTPHPKPFHPTHTYWITPHTLLCHNITILDLTDSFPSTPPLTPLSAPHKSAIHAALKDHTHIPTWTCHRTSLLGLHYTILNASSSPIGEWSHPWHSLGTAVLTFSPAEDAHGPSAPSHPLVLRPQAWYSRTETFVVDSVRYVWEMDSRWHSTNMTLWRVWGERREVVARYGQKWWGGWVTGGVVVVEERKGEGEGEVDMGMVACLTACVVLKRKRQRAWERRSGGE